MDKDVEGVAMISVDNPYTAADTDLLEDENLLYKERGES